MIGKVGPFTRSIAAEAMTGRMTKEEAAGCSFGEKAADAGFVGVVEEEEKIFVMSHKQVDYILSWDL